MFDKYSALFMRIPVAGKKLKRSRISTYKSTRRDHWRDRTRRHSWHFAAEGFCTNNSIMFI